MSSRLSPNLRNQTGFTRLLETVENERSRFLGNKGICPFSGGAFTDYKLQMYKYFFSYQ